jgi:hypothetical protein
MWKNWAGLSSPFRESPEVPANSFPNENTKYGFLKLEYLFAWQVLIREHRVIHTRTCMRPSHYIYTHVMWEPQTSTPLYKTISCIASSFCDQFSPKSSKNTPRLSQNPFGHLRTMLPLSTLPLSAMKQACSQKGWGSSNRAMRAMHVRSAATGRGDTGYFCHYFLFICNCSCI